MSKFTQNIQTRRGFIYNINFGLSVYRVAQLRYICGFLSALLLMYFSLSEKSLKNQIQSSIIMKSTEAVSFCYFPVHLIQSAANFVIDIIDVYEDNKKLKRDNQMIQEYILTRGYLDIQKDSAEKILLESLKLNNHIANAAVAYMSKNASVAFLDIRHIADKVKINAAVLCGGGLAGRIVGIENNLAKVLMVDNAESFIPISVSQSGIRGIVHGTGKSGSELIVADGEAVQIGDIVYTMSDDEVFKSHIPVGSLVGEGGKYSVRTICDPYKLNHMTIIL